MPRTNNSLGGHSVLTPTKQNHHIPGGRRVDLNSKLVLPVPHTFQVWLHTHAIRLPIILFTIYV
jgi:hypothetical protein